MTQGIFESKRNLILNKKKELEERILKLRIQLKGDEEIGKSFDEGLRETVSQRLSWKIQSKK